MKDALIYVQRLLQCGKFSQSVEEANSSKETGRQLASGVHLYGLCRQFSLAEIKAATNNFHEDLKIGKGSFSIVYKGFIDNGTVAVAVKRLSTTSGRGPIEFKNEVRFLCQLHHPNLVRLVGFCIEGGEVIIVHDYMNNFSLHHHVHGTLDPLSWEQRLKICIGVARGLHYLHVGVKYAIVHRDVKSFNILLDETYTPRICDFGLSKMGPLSLSKSLIKMESHIAGTFGYLDPEYFNTSQLTDKSDVYSFGVLLLEVLCARTVIGVDKDDENNKINLTDYACQCIENGSIHAIIDTYLEGKMAPESLHKFVEIAYDCVRPHGKNRPSMGEVEVTLELALELHERAQLHSHSR